MTTSARLDETELLPHILREKTGNSPRGLWLPLSAGGDGFQEWERILAVSRQPIASDSLHVFPAAIDSIREQAKVGWWSSLFRRGRQDDPAETVFIPNETAGKRIRPKRRDAILVVADDSTELSVELLRTHWPNAERFEQLGHNLWFVVGVVVSRE